MRIPLIDDNPLRVLGIFSNATLREQEQNKAQLRAFARVGQQAQLPLWLNGLAWLPKLPAVTEKVLTAAQSHVTLPSDHARHAYFWFERDSDHKQTDNDAIALLNDSNVSGARQLWAQRDDHAAQKNLLLLAVLGDDWPEIGIRASRCFADDIAGFRLFIAEVVKASDDANSPLSFMLLDHFETELWKKELERLLEDNHKRVLDKLIDDVKQIDSVSLLSLMGKELEEAVGKIDHVDSIKNLKGEQSIVYIYYANETAKTLLKAIHLYVYKYGGNAEWAVPVAKRLWGYVNENDSERSTLLRMKEQIVSWTKWNKTSDRIYDSFDKATSLEPKDNGCLMIFVKLLLFYLFLFVLGKACGPTRTSKKETDRFRYYLDEKRQQQIDSMSIQQVMEILNKMNENENNANH